MHSNSYLPEFLFYPVLPSGEVNIGKQLDSFLNQLETFRNKTGVEEYQLVKLTFFAEATNNSQFLLLKQNIRDFIHLNGLSKIPTTIVAQSPENNAAFSVETCFVRTGNISFIHYVTCQGVPCVHVQHKHYQLLISGEISADVHSTSIRSKCSNAFEGLEKILAGNGLDFSHVIRQWNYIEDITGSVPESIRKNQHYQLFNEVRSDFYRNSEFVNGYPAATGIGTTSGGIILDFIALKSDETIKILPVKSPVQTDAHQYSKNVLILAENQKYSRNFTPKFERAKLIVGEFSALLFVSGTAAIRGEQTVSGSDIAMQTRLTLENINLLSDKENLSASGFNQEVSSRKFIMLRAYVKFKENIDQVTAIIGEMHPGCPCTIIQSDICRENLLVEIEALLTLSF
jgi:enamine deaminase RidA (YjgF/YER057c/UK114 family)